MALSLNIPHDERNSSTPVHSPRFFCLARNFSDRYGSPVGSSPGSQFSSPLKGRSSSPITIKQRAASPFRHLQRFNVSSPRTPTPPLICSPTAVRSNLGANWTRAIVDVYQAQEPDELMEALQEIRSILAAQQKKDHLKFCKKDLEAALNEKKRRIPMLFIPTIRQFVLDLLADFFDQDHVNKLPSAVLTYIFGFLNTAKLGTACAVGRSWNEILSGDAIWKPLYIRRFRFLDPREAIGLRKFKDLYKERLLDPHIGDLVEVAWKGKFRLESLDIYQGLAWWSAIVVEKGDGSKYKIHYPGWDSRWDEWVHRDRLRWTVEHDLEARISPNDDVEIWCCGSNVPGAWLEAKVKRVKGKKYCVGRVTSSGTMWVDRDRVRLSPKWGRNLSSKQPQGFFSANTAASVSSSCSIM